MKYWMTENYKAYWEGSEEDMKKCTSPIEVPRRPSSEFVWQNGSWVFDPKKAQVKRQSVAYKEMLRLKPRETFGDDATIATYKTYMEDLRTWCLNPDDNARKPECPPNLK